MFLYAFYTFNAFKYNKYFISIPIFNDQLSINKRSNMLLFSENGYILSENLFLLKNVHMSVLNYTYSIDNKELYFYIYDKISTNENCIDCYSLEKDRISKIICNEEGFVQTKLINLINNNKTLNYECINEDGWIVLQLIDINNNLLFESLKYKRNELDKKIEWNNNIDFQNNQYYIKFIMYDCNLYSFSYNI